MRSVETWKAATPLLMRRFMTDSVRMEMDSGDEAMTRPLPGPQKTLSRRPSIVVGGRSGSHESDVDVAVLSGPT